MCIKCLAFVIKLLYFRIALQLSSREIFRLPTVAQDDMHLVILSVVEESPMAQINR